MDLNTTFNYGIYKGRTLQDVWFGSAGNELEIFENYLKNLLLNISVDGSDEKRPVVPLINDSFNGEEMALFEKELNRIRSTGIKYSVENLLVSFDGDLKGKSLFIIKSYQRILDLFFAGDTKNFQHKFYGTRVLLKEAFKDTAIHKAATSLLHFLPNPHYVVHEVMEGRIGINKTLLEFLMSVPIRYPKTLSFNHFDYYSCYCVVHEKYPLETDDKLVEVNSDKLSRNSKRIRNWKGYPEDHLSSGKPDNFCGACQERPCRCSDPW